MNLTIELMMVIVVCAAAIAAVASLASVVVVTLSNRAARLEARLADEIAAQRILALASKVARELLLEAQRDLDKKIQKKVEELMKQGV